MDTGAIDGALCELDFMVQFAILSAENLLGVEGKGVFQLPADDANRLDFCINDIERRLKALRAALFPDAAAKSNVLVLVRGPA
jgi:hypothetical protein